MVFFREVRLCVCVCVCVSVGERDSLHNPDHHMIALTSHVKLQNEGQ